MATDVAILVTVVAGEALDKMQDTSDEDLVEQCMKILKKMFPDHVSGKQVSKKTFNAVLYFKDVPVPLAWKVTHWSKRPYSMMSYSYTAPGASGDHYHIISQDVARTLYFAGEVV